LCRAELVPDREASGRRSILHEVQHPVPFAAVKEPFDRLVAVDVLPGIFSFRIERSKLHALEKVKGTCIYPPLF